MRGPLEFREGRFHLRGDGGEVPKFRPPRSFAPRREGPRPIIPERLAVEEDLTPSAEVVYTPLSGTLFDAQRAPGQRRRIPEGGLVFTPDVPPARTVPDSINHLSRETTVARAVSRVWGFGRSDRYGIVPRP